MTAQVDSLIRGVVDDLPSRINVGVQITPELYALEKESIWRRAWKSLRGALR